MSKQFVFFFYEIIPLKTSRCIFPSIVKDEKNWREFYADTDHLWILFLAEKYSSISDQTRSCVY